MSFSSSRRHWDVAKSSKKPRKQEADDIAGDFSSSPILQSEFPEGALPSADAGALPSTADSPRLSPFAEPNQESTDPVPVIISPLPNASIVAGTYYAIPSFVD